jgi:hypothetical protein
MSAATYVRDSEIVALRAGGASMGQIAARYGITKQRVGQICITNQGTALAKHGLGLLHSQHAAMIERRRGGATIAEIASEFSVHPETARRVCLVIRSCDAWAVRSASKRNAAILAKLKAIDAMIDRAQFLSYGLPLENDLFRLGEMIRDIEFAFIKSVEKGPAP